MTDVGWLGRLSPHLLAAINAELQGDSPKEEMQAGSSPRLRLANGRTIPGPYTIQLDTAPNEAMLRQMMTGARVEEYAAEFASATTRRLPVWDEEYQSVIHVDEADKDFFIGKNPQQRPYKAYIDIYPPDDPEEIVYV